MTLLFPENLDLVIEQVEVSSEITITLRSQSPTAVCPWCGVLAHRVQSRYTRQLTDLPFDGRCVHLLVQVRRFFCKKSTCVRKIFAEQFPALALPHAQRTLRLQVALRSIGLLLGGKPGSRLGGLLGYSGSADTILRLIRQTPLIVASSPQIIGLDDWAWKKRHRYGTIIVDQERHCVIDLLADRTVETVKTWLKAHPTVKIVSRDRSAEYATAIDQGAPQALQVADRFHLIQNLREAVQKQLAHYWKELRESYQKREELLLEEISPLEEEQRRSHSTPKREMVRAAREAERADWYERVVMLHDRGFTNKGIAKRLKLSERTVRRWLAQGTLTFTRRRRKKPSHFDRYAPYVLKRWNEGCHNGLQLWREIQAQGYLDSPHMVHQYLRMLRVGQVSMREESQTSPLETVSLQDATWLFIREPTDLNTTEQEQLTALRASHLQVDRTYELVQDFVQMARHRTGDQLETWLDEIAKSSLTELAQFADGVRADQPAVAAGLTLPYSNGIVEGHVNRLKLIKRSMYGRASFDLLRQRVLHHPENSENSHEATRGSSHQRQRDHTKMPGVVENASNSQHTISRISEVA